jgi:hypothetical protein
MKNNSYFKECIMRLEVYLEYEMLRRMMNKLTHCIFFLLVLSGSSSTWTILECGRGEFNLLTFLSKTSLVLRLILSTELVFIMSMMYWGYIRYITKRNIP